MHVLKLTTIPVRSASPFHDIYIKINLYSGEKITRKINVAINTESCKKMFFHFVKICLFLVCPWQRRRKSWLQWLLLWSSNTATWILKSLELILWRKPNIRPKWNPNHLIPLIIEFNNTPSCFLFIWLRAVFIPLYELRITFNKCLWAVQICYTKIIKNICFYKKCHSLNDLSIVFKNIKYNKIWA